MKCVYYFWFSVPHPGDEGFIAEYRHSLNFQFTSIAGLLGLVLAVKTAGSGRGALCLGFPLTAACLLSGDCTRAVQAPFGALNRDFERLFVPVSGEELAHTVVWSCLAL